MSNIHTSTDCMKIKRSPATFLRGRIFVQKVAQVLRRRERRIKHAYLTDECTELTRSEIIIDTSEDGNGDYNVAEETSKVVKGVNSD